MDSVVVNVRLPVSMVKQIEEESKENGYANKSEYIREAVRRMAQPTVREKVFEELVKRSIEVRCDSVSHNEVVQRIRKRQ